MEESEEIIELKDIIKEESKETAQSSKIVELKVTEQSPKSCKTKS